MLGSRDFLPVSQALAMETPVIGTPPAHRFRVAKFLQPPSNTHESSAAKERRRETKGVSMYSRQFPFHLVYCWSGRSVWPLGVGWSRILCHWLGTRLLVAGCLLLGAGFLIKLDATGPHGKFLM